MQYYSIFSLLHSSIKQMLILFRAKWHYQTKSQKPWIFWVLKSLNHSIFIKKASSKVLAFMAIWRVLIPSTAALIALIIWSFCSVNLGDSFNTYFYWSMISKFVNILLLSLISTIFKPQLHLLLTLKCTIGHLLFEFFI